MYLEKRTNRISFRVSDSQKEEVEKAMAERHIKTLTEFMLVLLEENNIISSKE